MAKEKESAHSVPALVDYESSSDVEDDRFTSNNLGTYWRAVLLKKWRAGGILFSIKDKTLMSRCLKEFSVEDVKQMVRWWVDTNDLSVGQNVGAFFLKRHALYEQIKPKDYTDWLQ